MCCSSVIHFRHTYDLITCVYLPLIIHCTAWCSDTLVHLSVRLPPIQSDSRLSSAISLTFKWHTQTFHSNNHRYKRTPSFFRGLTDCVPSFLCPGKVNGDGNSIKNFGRFSLPEADWNDNHVRSVTALWWRTLEPYSGTLCSTHDRTIDRSSLDR